MKQTYKNYLFSNFKHDFSESNIQRNELIVDEFYNIELGEGLIKSASSFKDYFANKFDKIEKYNQFYNKNEDILQKIIYFTVYNFYDEDLKIKGERYFAIDENLNLYEIDFDNVLITHINITFDKFPTIFNQNSYLYFYDKTGVYVCDCNNEIQFYSDVLALYDYAIQDDKLYFVVEEYPATVFISDRTEIINLTPYVELYDKVSLDFKEGKILKLFIIKNELYIFQQYKISVYNIYATKNQLSTEFVLPSKIINNTINCMNDYVVFLTTSGLMIFDGNNVEPAFAEITNKGDFKYDNMFSFVFNGKYYLNLKIKSNIKSCLISFDFEQKNMIYHVFDETVKGYEIIKKDNEYSLLLFCENSLKKSVLIQTHSPAQAKKQIHFKKVYFDVSDNKQINSIKFFAKGEFICKIVSDLDAIEIKASGNYFIQNLAIKGHLFKFEIYSEFDFEIEAILVNVMFIGDDL